MQPCSRKNAALTLSRLSFFCTFIVLDKYSCRVAYSDISTQTKKYVKSGNTDGVELVDLDKPCEEPVISESDLVKVTTLARAIEEFYNAPQDIEWALDNRGALYVLQSRPITTLGDQSSLSFLPPGDGFWT